MSFEPEYSPLMSVGYVTPTDNTLNVKTNEKTATLKSAVVCEVAFRCRQSENKHKKFTYCSNTFFFHPSFVTIHNGIQVFVAVSSR